MVSGIDKYKYRMSTAESYSEHTTIYSSFPSLLRQLYQHHGVLHHPVEEMDIPFADLQAKLPDIEQFPAVLLFSFVIPTNHLSYTSFSCQRAQLDRTYALSMD